MMFMIMRMVPANEFFNATALDEIFECDDDGKIKSFKTCEEADDLSSR